MTILSVFGCLDREISNFFSDFLLPAPYIFTEITGLDYVNFPFTKSYAAALRFDDVY